MSGAKIASSPPAPSWTGETTSSSSAYPASGRPTPRPPSGIPSSRRGGRSCSLRPTGSCRTSSRPGVTSRCPVPSAASMRTTSYPRRHRLRPADRRRGKALLSDRDRRALRTGEPMLPAIDGSEALANALAAWRTAARRRCRPAGAVALAGRPQSMTSQLKPTLRSRFQRRTALVEPVPRCWIPRFPYRAPRSIPAHRL